MLNLFQQPTCKTDVTAVKQSCETPKQVRDGCLGSKQIRNPGMLPFDVLTKIEHNTREKIKYQREADSQE